MQDYIYWFFLVLCFSFLASDYLIFVRLAKWYIAHLGALTALFAIEATAVYSAQTIWWTWGLGYPAMMIIDFRYFMNHLVFQWCGFLTILNATICIVLYRLDNYGILRSEIIGDTEPAPKKVKITVDDILSDTKNR